MRTIDAGVLVQETPPYREEWKVVTGSRCDSRRGPGDAFCMEGLCPCKEQCDCLFQHNQDPGDRSGPDEPRRRRENRHRKSLSSLAGSAVASDAFLPFPDTLEVAAAAGQQPSSSPEAPSATRRSSRPRTGSAWPWCSRASGISGTEGDRPVTPSSGIPINKRQ